jgi:hypothetical protein
MFLRVAGSLPAVVIVCGDGSRTTMTLGYSTVRYILLSCDLL